MWSLAGAASVARGLSAYIDRLADNAMGRAFNESMHMYDEFLSMRLAEYPDFFAAAMVMLFICEWNMPQYYRNTSKD
jgi:hypothetical protein